MYSPHTTLQLLRTIAVRFALTRWHFTQHAKDKVSHESDHKTWELLSLASPMHDARLNSRGPREDIPAPCENELPFSGRPIRSTSAVHNRLMSGLLRASSRLSGAGSERSDSPAEALHSEGAHADRPALISYWKARARQAEKSLEEARAALNDNQGVRAYMEPASSDIYKQGRVLREKMRRWDPANWAQLSMIAMDCVVDDGEDVRETIWETPWVKRALHGKLEEDRAECAEYLATHALHWWT